MTGGRKALAVLLAAALSLAGAPRTAQAQASEERYGMFADAVKIAGQLDAMDDLCRRHSEKDTSIGAGTLVDQLMQGFAVEKGSDGQRKSLESAAKESFEAKRAELDARQEVNCATADFLWEKHALTEKFSQGLKRIIEARKGRAEKDSAPANDITGKP